MLWWWTTAHAHEEEAVTMSRKSIDTDRTMVIGVDVASQQHVAVIRGPGGRVVGPFAFRNDGRENALRGRA
jgi:hypothetical protein